MRTATIDNRPATLHDCDFVRLHNATSVRELDHGGPVLQFRVHFVYIVRCADGTLYTGYARDPKARVKVHNSGRGARYTSGRRPVRLIYSESFESVGDALRRERALKRRSRAQKEALIGRRVSRPGGGRRGGSN
jgi:putative endonuclease